MPFVSPVTVIGLPVLLPVFPPGLAVAVYEVMALPPFEAGGVNDTVACVFPGTA